MPKKLTEITATVACERRRFGEAAPFTLIMDGSTEGAAANGQAASEDGVGRPSRIVLKGKSEGEGEREEPRPHQTYRFYGRWTRYKNPYSGHEEEQFLFDTFVRQAPHSRAGVISYLKQAPGIGHALAARLFDKFGSRAVKVLREQPAVAAAACERLSDEAATEAAAWLEREKSLEDCTIEIVDLLAGRGFPRGLPKELVKEFGNRAASVIRSDPYKLMQFRGAGFKRADALYLDLGLPPAKLKRQAYCATYHAAQASASSGDTWVFRKVVEVGLAGSIAGADVRLERAIELADRGGIMAVAWTDEIDGPPSFDGAFQWVADARKARNEQRLADYVCEALADDARWPIAKECGDMSDHQFEQASLVTRGALGIIGGSPGTGKTFTAAQLIRGLGEEFGFNQIACAAPTGKAAVRLTEAMNAYQIPLVARTIHSLLKVQSADGGWSFAFNRANPLPYKVLVIDEASMIDTDLAASLLAARARGTLVLIIGDVNQLPPVGHGAPLRDMIAAGVPYGELREIRRNSGGIVQACADIRDGKPFRCEGNLELVAAQSAREQREAMLQVVDAKARAFGVDPVWGVQVLCAVNKKSELSRRDLNKLLQHHLNPNPAISGSPFRLRDKVICVKNSWLPLVEIASRNGKGRVELVDNDENLTLNDKNQVYVANGEMGEVVRIEPGFFHVQLAAPKRLVVVPRGKADEKASDEPAGDEEGNVEESTGTGCDWELGYAISTHKSQGSEFPVAVVMVDESGGAKRVCSREWLYTSISRAKQCCVLIGKLAVAQSFTKRTAIDKRKTFLAHKIKEGMRAL